MKNKLFCILVSLLSLASVNHSLEINHMTTAQAGIGGYTKPILGVNIPHFISLDISASYGIILDGWLLKTGFGYSPKVSFNFNNKKSNLLIKEHYGDWSFSFGYLWRKKVSDKSANPVIRWTGVSADIGVRFNDRPFDITLGLSGYYGMNRLVGILSAGISYNVTSLFTSKIGGYGKAGLGIIF